MKAIADGRDARAVGASSHKFFLSMSIACLAVAFLGFAPTYWVGLARGTFKANPIIHVHGAVFFGWTIYFVFQTWLGASGRIARHRSWGLLGVSLATAMVIFGFLAAVNSIKVAAATGHPDAGKAFSIVPLSAIAFFAAAVTLAIVKVHNAETHKRLMLLASVSILDAAIARWFITFLAPPGAAGPPPVSVDLLPAAATLLMLVVAMLWDIRTRGRPHSAYIYGGLALIAVKLLQIPVSATSAWNGLAGALLKLAQ